LVWTCTISIAAQTRVAVAVVVSNAPSKTSPSPARLEVQVTSRSDYFSSQSTTSWASASSAKSGRTTSSVPLPGSARFADTGVTAVKQRVMMDRVMMDVSVVDSVLVSGITLEVPASPEQTLRVLYKQGTYASAIRNLSEWRLLGSVSTHELQRNGSSVRLDLSALTSQFPNASHQAQQLALAIRARDTSISGVPGVSSQQAWLGARPDWVDNSLIHMSSSLSGQGVDLRAVLNLSPDALWHSGNGSGVWSEDGCPHLPKCPKDWAYDKNQWLAFDARVCYTLSAFRTSFPNYTQAPAYYYRGIRRANTSRDDWHAAHFKSFELQYSVAGLQGPWRTALSGEAQRPDIVQGPQEFAFQPVTARYWRLLLRNTFGFVFMALQTLEFFGFESMWCAESVWCQSSLQCRAADASLVSGVPHMCCTYGVPHMCCTYGVPHMCCMMPRW